MLRISTFVIVCILLSLANLASALPDESSDQGFVKLFNGTNWDGWDLKIRSGDAGLAKKVFAIEDGMVHVFNDEFPDKY